MKSIILIAIICTIGFINGQENKGVATDFLIGNLLLIFFYRKGLRRKASI
jgi:hypothetical protein